MRNKEVNMRVNLKHARVNAGIKQIDMAEAMGVSKQTVNKWEMGRAPVAKTHWSKIASLLGVQEQDVEKILVQTTLDGCIASKSPNALINAQISRLYSASLVYDALLRFEESTRTNANGTDKTTDELERLHYERAILDRDRRIFELEKEVDELKRQLKELKGE